MKYFSLLALLLVLILGGCDVDISQPPDVNVVDPPDVNVVDPPDVNVIDDDATK